MQIINSVIPFEAQASHFPASITEMRLKRFLWSHWRRLHHAWRYYRAETGLPAHVPRGHYYSALPQIEDGAQHAAKVARSEPSAGLPAINLHAAAQRELLEKMCALYPEFDWTKNRTPGRRFHFDQEYYMQADSLCLYAMLRLAPAPSRHRGRLRIFICSHARCERTFPRRRNSVHLHRAVSRAPRVVTRTRR